MNPNDIIAQQQAFHDQLLKMAQHDYWSVAWPYVVIGSIQLVALGVIALFCYVRLRDIADELRKFRIAFEMAEDRKPQSAAPAPPRADDDSRYLPKS
ncbi:MAG: hypothetical protein ABSC89_05105 [Verrucomicrobiota bacterium]|jgi:hypothetical protein